MKICIHKKMLGTDRHITYDTDEGTYLLSASIPDEAWTLGDPSRVNDLEDLSLAIGRPLHTHPGGKWLRQFQELFNEGVDDWKVDVPWAKVMPRREFQAYVKGMLQKAQEILAIRI